MLQGHTKVDGCLPGRCHRKAAGLGSHRLADQALKAPDAGALLEACRAGLTGCLPCAQEAPTPEGGERGGGVQNRLRSAAVTKGQILLRETHDQSWSLPLAQHQLKHRGLLEPQQVLALTHSMQKRLVAALRDARDARDAQCRAQSSTSREARKQSQLGQAQPQVRGGAQPWRRMQGGAVVSGRLC